jgi:hypothetical protein
VTATLDAPRERNPVMGESPALVTAPAPDFAPGDASVFAAYPGPYPTPDVVVDLREHRIDVARLLKASTFGSGNFVLPNRRPCRCPTRGLQRGGRIQREGFLFVAQHPEGATPSTSAITTARSTAGRSFPMGHSLARPSRHSDSNC